MVGYAIVGLRYLNVYDLWCFWRLASMAVSEYALHGLELTTKFLAFISLVHWVVKVFCFLASKVGDEIRVPSGVCIYIPVAYLF